MSRFRPGESLSEWNDRMVDLYDPGAYHERSNAAIRGIERARTRQIVRLLDAHPGQWIVEVGVGAGNVLGKVPVGRRFGLDLSMRLLNDARRRLGARASLVRGDAASLPIATRSVDRIICSEVLEHLPNPADAIAEISRVVRGDGVVVLSVPNEALIDRIKGVLRRLRLLAAFSSSAYRVPAAMKDEWHIHEFSLSMLQDIVRPHLRIERTVAVPSRILPIRYVARCVPRSPDYPGG
jgi:ubiquinone/menaquinone biosynthesis C-methylase UbiE